MTEAQVARLGARIDSIAALNSEAVRAAREALAIEAREREEGTRQRLDGLKVELTGAQQQAREARLADLQLAEAEKEEVIRVSAELSGERLSTCFMQLVYPLPM